MSRATVAKLAYRSALRIRRRRSRAGIALIMVVAVVGVAAVLGYVMLSSATLQGRAGSNHGKLVSADSLAESGVNVAMYFLQRPEAAPAGALTADGYWGGFSGSYTLPNGLPCTLTVSVAQAMDTTDPNAPTPIPWTYEIVSTAEVGDDSAGGVAAIARTAGARVYVENEYVLKYAGVFNGDAKLVNSTTFNGDVWTSRFMSMKVGAQTPQVIGAGYARTWQNPVLGLWTKPTGNYRAAADLPQASPSNAEVNLYKLYEVDEVTYSAATVGSSSLSGTTGVVTKTSSASNPAGIWYYNATSGGAFVLYDHVTIDGTLVIEGDCQIRGAGIQITPKAGYPAMIVTGNLEIYQYGKSLTVNGACYVGGQLRSNGTPPTLSQSSTFTVNGGLLIGAVGSDAFSSGYNIKTVVNYNAANAKAPEMSSILRTPKGVRVLRWGLP